MTRVVVDVHARHGALAAVRPSPARLEAPEPDVWLPIDLTAELEALDLTAELELLSIEEGRESFDRELEALESEFWRTAEAAHPFLTGALPGGARSVAEDPPAADVSAAEAPHWARREPGTEPEAARACPDGEPDRARDDLVEVDPLPLPEAYVALAPTRPAIAGRRRALRLRRRLVGTALVVVVGIAAAAGGARALGGTPPRRDVTVAVDGRSSTIVTRAGTVGDVLASQGVVLGPGDEVVPGVGARLSQGLAIHVRRAFPLVVDVDGVVTRMRTTRHSLTALRRRLDVPKRAVRVDDGGRLGRGDEVVFRTPHRVDVVVDGTTTPIPRSTALTVGELLAAQQIVLGPSDEVVPAADAHLTDGMTVQVARLAEDQVAEDKIVPFPTEYRDDATLAAGRTHVIQEGRNGLERVISNVVKRDETIVEWNEAYRVTVRAPVPRVLARGTKAAGRQPPAAPTPTSGGGALIGSGTATWYRSHAGSGACAHLTLPFGTLVKLVASNGRTATCRVGDRGPEAWTGNVIDLNPDVFSQLAPLGTGKIFVTMYRAS